MTTPNQAVDQTANDDNPAALAAAANNFRLLVDRWHNPTKCNANLSDPEGEDVAYFRDPETGYHGWLCVKCRHVVQTG